MGDWQPAAGFLYDPCVPQTPKLKTACNLALDTVPLRPGMRVAVALSGGADSVALLCALAGRREELGLVLHAAHLHHGLRGREADGDLAFSRELAAGLGVPLHEACVDTGAAAKADAATGKPAETIEEAARRLRYAWFWKLLSKGAEQTERLDAIATAHTLDDQAETVLGKFLRGAWTEGLAGISPKIEAAEAGAGCIVRPMLGVRRVEVEAYLHGLGQEWREDSTNRSLEFTRNRIRHELLPLLEGWNPRLREHLAQMAELARGDEAWWQTELARLTPQMILPGRPARGGGRTAGEGMGAGLAVDVHRFAALAPALQRRLVRFAAEQMGAALDFGATEAVRSLALEGRGGQMLTLPQGLLAERTARELRLATGTARPRGSQGRDAACDEYMVLIPGEIEAPELGVRLKIEYASAGRSKAGEAGCDSQPQTAILRNWRAGDRVWLRYTSGPRKVKEVLERRHVTGTQRAVWPVLELDGRIVWMQGVELEPEPGLTVRVMEPA